MRPFITFVSLITLLSCQSGQESILIPQFKLIVDEVLISLPDDMPNDWEGFTSSIEQGKKIIHLYDRFNKKIVQFSLDREELIQQISFFSDTLNIGNYSFGLCRIKDGYFLSSNAFGFIILNDEGEIIRIWDNYIPRSSPISNWQYNSKFRLRTYKTLTQSMFDDWNTPILIEFANVGFDAVYRDDFTEHDIFGKLDLKDGELNIFPIRFPGGFNVNGYSYPGQLLPSFTAMDESKLAYSFGIDDKIHILSTESGQIEEYKVSNPNFPVNIPPIDKLSFFDQIFMEDFNSKASFYISLYYDPNRKGLVRVGYRQGMRIFELLDNNMNIVGQFEQPEFYSGRPLFFPNEMWFPYLQGYKEDEMKLMRVRIEE